MISDITLKKCSHCKKIKSVSEFSKNCSKKDGYNIHCKVCKKVFAKKYYQSEKGKIFEKAHGERRRKTETYKAYQRTYQRQYHHCYPEQIKARNAVNNAIAAGMRPPTQFKCTYCPSQAQQYHHPDYSKPFDVEPVCVSCHNKLPFTHRPEFVLKAV
jgi:hypothetical protein